uniref:Integrase catalytic domain-containing protein n=1 Tax=Cacopsylla melanoneura TaxID=428564 RepID=A0A8D9ARL7_9HEMI
MSTGVQKEKLLSLKNTRARYHDGIKALHDLSINLDAANVLIFTTRLERLEEYYNSYDSLTLQIIELCAAMDPADNVNTAADMAAFEEMYFHVKAFAYHNKYLPLAVDASPSRSAPPAPHPIQPRLPKLEIPTFSGDLKDWSNFHSLFKSTIHRRTDISEVEKLQYLRSFLKGPPLILIENLQITHGSYDIGYKLLRDRYDNKRTLAAYYLNAIMNFKQLTNDNSAGLRTFLETFQTNVAAIKNLGIADIGDFLLLQLSLRALSPGIKKMFEDMYEQVEFPKFDELLKFVNKQCAVSDLVQSSTTKVFTPVQTPRNPALNHKPFQFGIKKSSYLSTIESTHSDQSPTVPRDVPTTSNSVNTSSERPDGFSQTYCFLCKQPHSISKCPEFARMNVAQRIETIKSQRRCFNCLGNHHKSACRSKGRCQTCKKSHHTLIHEDMNDYLQAKSTRHDKSTPAVQNVSVSMSTSQHRDCSTIMLGTASATILDSSHQPVPVRILIDPGSQVSCITNDCVQRLGLKRYRCGVSISGIGDNGVPNNQGAVTCTLATSKQVVISENVQAIVLSRISSTTPSVPISHEVIKRFSNLSLADPDFHKPGPIDFLIGAELYCKILCPHSVIPGEPTAINTTLGWIILGRAPIEIPHASMNSFLIQSPSLETIMNRFWEIEEVEPPLIQDPDDIKCEEHFQKTHYRDVTGRYIVALPFHGDPAHLDTNRQTALRQYANLEKRLDKNSPLKKEYNDFFSDYCAQGHMTPAPSDSRYVIPHHSVVKLTSSTTRVRAVFNASASSSHGQSLNNLLMKGPKLQKDICEIILNLRGYRIVVCADVRQMYRQILIRPEDRKYQHIFWRSTEDAPITEYELATVTYGVTPSAFQAQRVLQQLVHDDGASFPLASRAILNETYIDDILSGADDLSQALQLKEELITLLSRGSFELRKWASNSQELLKTVPHEHCEVPLRQNEESTFKILGLHWQSTTDSFAYHVADINPTITKRSILSNVARMFDPLGWLSPVLFWAKHLLQCLWLSNLSWDDPLPPDFSDHWKRFSAQLPSLEELRIPRYIEISPQDHVQLVGFCDASSKGYAAVIYLVGIVGSNPMLVKAKSKVAPTKQLLSIPRLELCAAVLLSRLYNSLRHYLSKHSIEQVTFYSDSNIVLAWLRTQPHLLQTYVANRVVEINKLADGCSWYHVPSTDNPCDCASRGLFPQELVIHPLWWHGPDFLLHPNHQWPSGQGQAVDEVPELKRAVNTLAVTATASTAPSNELVETIQKFSKLTRLQRVFAFVLRFAHNIRHPNAKLHGPLQVGELNSSLDFLIKLEQTFHFKKVLSELKNSSPPKDASLRKLTPFIDDAGLIRVGGRLHNSGLPYDRKHPLLLPKYSHLSILLCDHYHLQALHAGPRTTQALIQQKFWIISLRDLLRQRIFKCLKCYRYSAKPPQPIMADLPAARVAEERPFLNVGVDFGGPFLIKESSRRNARAEKAYLCLFVCFTTKAVHLEVVCDLSSAAFLAALDRFIARRGLPRCIYSDNGTNFTASARELGEVYAMLRDNCDELTDTLALRQIKWTFNPPAASNFGGLWEAGIKSAKHHFRRVIGSQLLTLPEFESLACRIEAILNSRPLLDLSPDPSDNVDYLSPGHFLIGTSLLSPPEEDSTQVPMNRLSRWRLIQRASQSFWKVWSSSYLQSLTPRNKWYNNDTTPKVGDLVLLPKLHQLALHWPIGRILSTHPGKDGVVRVVTVKTGNSVLTRPINKVIPLLQ